MKKILLYIGRIYSERDEENIDGGSIVFKQLIETLSNCSVLDVAFIRENRSEIISNKNIRNIYYYDYLKSGKYKFESRLLNFVTNKEALKKYDDYDIIIGIHISHFFGLDDFPLEFWKKTIIFPMFLTPSYQRSNENVPIEYFNEEKKVLEKVSKIITPSITEKNDLINVYGIKQNKISIVPRGINPCFNIYHFGYNKKEPLKLFSIGSIRKQKNQIDSIKVIEELNRKGIDSELTIISNIQDEKYYKSLCEYIKKNNLEKKIIFKWSLTQTELARYIKYCHINISTSNWETFGRGIYEGLCSGKPTFIFNSLVEVTKFVGTSNVLIPCDGQSDLVNKICTLIDKYDEFVLNNQQDFQCIREKVSYDKESILLKEEILSC